MTTPALWEAWAPPLDPPIVGALPYATAAQIAEVTNYPADPHLTAAMQWEAYAFSLTPTPTYSAVSTGGQSATLSPAQPTGEFGVALAQAQRHWNARGNFDSVQLARDYDSSPSCCGFIVAEA